MMTTPFQPGTRVRVHLSPDALASGRHGHGMTGTVQPSLFGEIIPVQLDEPVLVETLVNDEVIPVPITLVWYVPSELEVLGDGRVS